MPGLPYWSPAFSTWTRGFAGRRPCGRQESTRWGAGCVARHCSLLGDHVHADAGCHLRSCRRLPWYASARTAAGGSLSRKDWRSRAVAQGTWALLHARRAIAADRSDARASAGRAAWLAADGSDHSFRITGPQFSEPPTHRSGSARGGPGRGTIRRINALHCLMWCVSCLPFFLKGDRQYLGDCVDESVLAVFPPSHHGNESAS